MRSFQKKKKSSREAARPKTKSKENAKQSRVWTRLHF